MMQQNDRSTVWLVGLITIVTIVSSGMVRAESVRIDAPPSGVELGLAWDGDRSRLLRNRCVQFAPIQEGGQEATLSLSEVSDSEELRQHLGVSVSASIHGIVGSASASAEFAENSDVKTSSTNFAVRATITNGAMFAGPHRPPAPRRYAFSSTEVEPTPRKPEPPGEQSDSVRILDWVLDEIKKDSDEQSRYNAFVKLCGTDFVSAIYSGVEMFNIISISTTDQNSKQAVKAAVSGSYGIGAASAQADADVAKTLAQTNARMSFYQRGGAGGILPSSREKVLQKLDVLAREATEAPEFFDMDITPYSDLPNWPFTKKPEREEAKHIVVRRYYQLKTFYRDLQAVIDNLRAQEQGLAVPSDDEGIPQPADYDRCYPAAHYESLQDSVITVLRYIEVAQQKVIENDEWDYTNFNITDNKETINTYPAIQSLTPANSHWRSQDADESTTPFLSWLRDTLSVAHLKAMLPPLKMGGTSLCSKPFTQQDAYQNLVMESYVRAANVRTCERNVTDSNCLENLRLDLVKQGIPYPLQQLEPKAGKVGYLCSARQVSPMMCVSKANVMGKKKPDTHYALTGDKSLAALITVTKGDEDKSVRFRVESANTGEEPTAIKRGTNYRKSGDKSIVYMDVTEPDPTELSWKVIPIQNDAREGMRLLDTKYNLCLGNWDKGMLLAYPNTCKVTAKPGTWTSDVYGWIFYDPTWFENH
ncbi:MAG: hypothetical protein NPIRA05_05470 [Nitrospirales bacterium]|nr:MAG: hypothetical protein NPIRA05_05470 [Nitrospirales bacterium]